MCGIVHVKRKDGKAAARSVLKRYREQKSRGSAGFGYVAIENNRVVSYERSAVEHEIIEKLQKETASEILFHHRFPTSTPNIAESAHPILVESPTLLDHTYYVAHNGMIRNTEALHTQHIEKGFEYSTEITKQILCKNGEVYDEDIDWNDTESLAIETALTLDGKKGWIDTEGAASVVGLKVKDGRVIDRFFFRNTANPLKFYEDNVMITITSEGKGTVVEPVRIMRLKEGGGMEKIEPIVLVPATYSYPNAYNDYSEGRVTSAGRYLEDLRQPMGFRQISDILPPKDEGAKTIAEAEAERAREDEEMREEFPLADWTLGMLWPEHGRIQGLIQDTRFEIKILDTLVENGSHITDEQLSERSALQLRLDDFEEYELDLRNELMARDQTDAIVEVGTRQIDF